MSGFSERAVSLFYRMAVSGALPVSWFRDIDPATVVKAKKTGKLTESNGARIGGAELKEGDHAVNHSRLHHDWRGGDSDSKNRR